MNVALWPETCGAGRSRTFRTEAAFLAKGRRTGCRGPLTSSGSVFTEARARMCTTPGPSSVVTKSGGPRWTTNRFSASGEGRGYSGV